MFLYKASFIKEQIVDAKKSNVLLSLHMKATMMKVSDPIIFGHVIRLFFEDIFNKYKSEFTKIGVNPNNGLENIFEKLNKLESADSSLFNFSKIFSNPLFGFTPILVNSDLYLLNISSKNRRITCPKIIGSLTFIIVAFICNESKTFDFLASTICSFIKLAL